jgi:hypothetical protein
MRLVFFSATWAMLAFGVRVDDEDMRRAKTDTKVDGAEARADAEETSIAKTKTEPGVDLMPLGTDARKAMEDLAHGKFDDEPPHPVPAAATSSSTAAAAASSLDVEPPRPVPVPAPVSLEDLTTEANVKGPIATELALDASMPVFEDYSPQVAESDLRIGSESDPNAIIEATSPNGHGSVAAVAQAEAMPSPSTSLQHMSDTEAKALAAVNKIAEDGEKELAKAAKIETTDDDMLGLDASCKN